ncbi:MAG: hypothetical protein C4555_07385, partial [Dehalococcoidia bacterium]
MKENIARLGICITLALILSAALMTSPAMGAQDALTIKSMKVSVWPEYDDPRILVTYQGEFNDGTLFPRTVKFPMPTGSEIAQVCALRPPNNEHLCQLYDTLAEPDQIAVSYNLPIPTYYLEYYWDGISSQPDKAFTFSYTSPYAIENLEIEVQQPLRATDFKLAQPYLSAASDSRGMKYYRYVFNDVAPGQPVSIEASYTKPDNKPSVAKTTGGQTGGATGSNPYGVIGIGTALLAAAVIGFVLLRRKPA